MRMRKDRFAAGFVLVLLCLFSFVQLADAAPLYLDLSGHPDITTGFIDITYNASTGALQANGFAFTLDDDGSAPPEDIINGNSMVAATIDTTGSLIGGTVSIGGTVATLGMNSGVLLEGILSGFGFSDVIGVDTLEFLFDITAGDAANLYGGVGTTVGIIMGSTGFSGTFAQDFDNLMFSMPGTGAGYSDTCSLTPEPTSLALLLLALPAVRLRRRHRGN